MKFKITLLFLIGISCNLFSQNLWSLKTSVPGSVRAGGIGFSVSGKGYMGLGSSSGGVYHDDMWQYDPMTDSWTQVANYGGGVVNVPVAFVINNVGYVGTGWTPAGSKKFYKYDETGNTWIQVADFPGYGSYTNVAAVAMGKAYVGIGYSPYNNQWFEYDPLNDTWAQKASFPPSFRNSCSAFALNNKIYVGLGAREFNATTTVPYNDFYEYDPASDTWLQLPSFPGSPRYGTLAFTLSGKAYVVGGYDYSVYNNECWEFDPFTYTWTQLANFPGIPRSNIASFVIGNAAYVGTGVSGNFYNDFYKFSSNEDKLISGYCFYDDNNNMTYDAGELPATYMIINSNPGNEYWSSGNNGQFSIAATSAIYALNIPNPPMYYTIAPVTNTVDMTSTFVDSTVMFALYPVASINDLRIDLTPLNTVRGGQHFFVNVTYKNVGTEAATDTIVVDFDTTVTFIQSLPAGAIAGTNSIQWPFSYLLPGETRTFKMMFDGNPSIMLGDTIHMNAVINPVAGDSVPSDNYYNLEQIAVGSFDPNDISVNKATLTPQQVAAGPWLEYLIRFQNTGNAEAINIHVADVLPAELDLGTFEIISTSHNCNVQLKENGKMTFWFDNINLPDSTSNEPESHGFIKYRIKPLTTLTLGQTINNSAAIYFDFNAPVITNTAITQITTVSEINNTEVANLLLYPNPAIDYFNVPALKGYDGTCTVIISDVTGRIVATENAKDSGNNYLISIQSLNTGIYIVRAELGNTTLSGKIIKK